MKTFSEIITFANRPTGSGQIYTTDVLDSAFDIYMSKDKAYRYGCMEPPDADAVIDVDRISHHLLDVYWNNDELWGTIEIAESLPMGKILSTLVDANPKSLTLGLAAMATFKPKDTLVVSRNLFEVYDEAPSKEVDNMVVAAVYVLDKKLTNH